MAKKNVDKTNGTDQEETLTTEEPLVEETPPKEPTAEDQLQQLKDQMLRDRAELENFKRRMNEERIKERKYAQQGVLRKLVDILDNLERGMNAEYKDVDAFKDGLKSVVKQVELTLQEESVTEIESLHQPFDATKHQAVMTDNHPDYDNQIVLDVFQKGYMYKDRILRPSMVKVNQKED
jgi:molecular chaperone GrpE